MRLSLLLFALISAPTLARSSDPDTLPPPVLKAEPSVTPENPNVRPAEIVKAIPSKKKKGRALASVDHAEPEPAFPENGDVVKAKRHGKCPSGYRIADFHGWLCAKE